MNLGVDIARSMTTSRYQPGIGLRPSEPGHAVAPSVPLLYAALYDSIAAHSRGGLNVVAEFGHHDAAILSDCAGRLEGLPALLVGVRCPLDAIIARRAGSPSATGSSRAADEAPAPVRRWQDAVHVHGLYDVEVGTSALTPEQCADAIRRRLAAGSRFAAFRQLTGPASSASP
jgi:chloramphenicol 3-O phosphotransferase